MPPSSTGTTTAASAVPSTPPAAQAADAAGATGPTAATGGGTIAGAVLLTLGGLLVSVAALLGLRRREPLP
ncbi:MAG: hypothetical protein NTU93_05610 [Arthrobacter sp.]|nr:hypothetical protein [Arthrobacter sp.]